MASKTLTERAPSWVGHTPPHISVISDMSPATRSNTSSSRQASAVSNAPSLIEGHVNKRYPAAFTRWGSTAVEVLHPTLPLPLAIIPIQYLAGCGVNSWAYIYQVIAMVADVGSNAIICQQHTDDAISRTATTAPSAGLYVLKATGEHQSALLAARP